MNKNLNTNNFKDEFNAIYNRELKGAIIKAIVYSLLIGFSVLFTLSFILWVTNVDQYWISFIAFFAVALAVFGILFYFFKPNDNKISKKLDSLGLKQRVITMVQYRDDDSLMARIQRQNAKEHMNGLNLKLLKVAIPTLVIIFTCVAFVLGAASTTVAALSSHNIIGKGSSIISEIIPTELQDYEVEYGVQGEGEIKGELFQVVKHGDNATGVLAEAFVGFEFIKWSDGYDRPYREDLDVQNDIYVIAIFEEIDDSDQAIDEQETEDGDPSDQGDEESDRPSDASEQQSNKNGENENDPDDPTGGGSFDDNNQVIDGETYYGNSTFDAAYGDAQEAMQGNNNMDSNSKSIASSYFDNIQK